MTPREIKQVVQDFARAAERSVETGVDVIETIRDVIPANMPLFIHMSATEFLEDIDIGNELG